MHDMQNQASRLHPDRLLPVDSSTRDLARQLHNGVADAPLLCPHGHTEASWFATNGPFSNATDLLITPDHYVLRMLMSQGVSYDALGVQRADGSKSDADPRNVWHLFARHYPLFRGTPSRLWLDHSFHEVLELPFKLNQETADAAYDHINSKLADDAFRPRALLKRFNIELLATTDAATDDLLHHQALQEEGLKGIVPTFRPDAVTNPLRHDFAQSMARLAQLTGQDVAHWEGYLEALRARRAAFKALGATATDHGVLHPQTANLPAHECQALLDAALAGSITQKQGALFEAQMLFEMARMSVDDGLVMQIHAGSQRNYAPSVFDRYGFDKGFDIPIAVRWADGLKVLLDVLGFEPNLAIILYTLDETAYGRELAPLAGAFPCLTLGAPWWFFDSPEGLRRYRTTVTETAGYYNTAGFVDDTRAFLSIPARHDMFRRVEASNLATLVAQHVLPMDEAMEIMEALTGSLVRKAYRLPSNKV